ncbi:MAG: citrate lyase acyl carrier protein [Sulfurospirillum sp.]
MRKIKKSAYAGTLESSDAFIQIEPIDEDKIKIELQSSVEEMYGDDIRELIKKIIKELDISYISVKVQDKGALDYVIKARLQAAILRANEDEKIEWDKL